MNKSILEEAVNWLVLLRSGEARPADMAACRRWRDANADHEAALHQLEQSLEPFDVLRTRGVSPQMVQKVVSSSVHRSKRRATNLALGGLAIGTGSFALWAGGETGMMADARTGPGQRLEAPLPSGGMLWLDAKTALDTSAGTHRLRLYHGRLIARCPLQSAQPMIVQTPIGHAVARNARLMMSWRDDAEGLQVTALEGAVSVSPLAGASLPVPPGQRLVLGADGSSRSEAAGPDDTLWTRGLIALDNEPLGRLVAELRVYRAGILRIEPAAAALCISGVFSLDNSELTLRALAETQPVQVTWRTPYWVTISAA